MVNWREGITHLRKDYNRRDPSRKVKLDAVFDDRVSIVYYYPTMKPDIIDSLVDNGYRGIVIAGTGLGHVNKPLYPAIKRAVDSGVNVFMTVQTLWGYVQMYVYDTGRDLMALGVVPLENMLPEVAFVKLGWVLGHTNNREKVIEMMLTPINSDITEREPYNGYLIFQGGVPEVQKFLKEFWR
jgi:glutamyl-tRNA(Gln) amidotransferase subunit D